MNKTWENGKNPISGPILTYLARIRAAKVF